ncbi:hypothetical protein [Burkholderia vietnamiensis]|uniref:hypothetical protein n=1 Tax=Burkholderia vietnamiensis TaxID=60552 RepID=UPI0015944648|nr:hypothetical protein [Burkholderia vietnamiensis]
MANNLFITYDLKENGGTKRDYQPVFNAIAALGEAKHLELSQFYVNSTLSAEAAAKKVWSSMQSGDKLVVLDTTGNHGYWYGLSDPTSKFMQDRWMK